MHYVVAERGGLIILIVGLGIIAVATKWLLSKEVPSQSDQRVETGNDVIDALTDPLELRGNITPEEHPIVYWTMVIGVFIIGFSLIGFGTGLIVLPDKTVALWNNLTTWTTTFVEVR